MFPDTIGINKEVFAQLHEEMSWYAAMPQSLDPLLGGSLHVEMHERMAYVLAFTPELKSVFKEHYLMHTPSAAEGKIVMCVLKNGTTDGHVISIVPNE